LSLIRIDEDVIGRAAQIFSRAAFNLECKIAAWLAATLNVSPAPIFAVGTREVGHLLTTVIAVSEIRPDLSRALVEFDARIHELPVRDVLGELKCAGSHHRGSGQCGGVPRNMSTPARPRPEKPKNPMTRRAEIIRGSILHPPLKVRHRDDHSEIQQPRR